MLTHLFIDIHQVGLDDKARSQGVSNTAAVGLVVGGVGREAGLGAFSIGVGDADGERTSRVAGANVPSGRIASSP